LFGEGNEECMRAEQKRMNRKMERKKPNLRNPKTLLGAK
jgi:hypothetical protein